MLIIALVLALLFDILAVSASRALLRRSARRSRDGRSSGRARAVAIGGGALAIAISTVVASLATTTVQGDIVMMGMRRYEPFRTILATDPGEAVKLRAAVDRGLEEDGPIRERVRASVEREVAPYLKDRVAHAPDHLVVEMGRQTLASLVGARGEGEAACRSLMSGDAAALARHGDGAARQTLLARIVAAPYVYDPERPTAGDEAYRTVDAAPGASACDISIAATRRILTLPERQAARLLRDVADEVPTQAR